MSTTEIKAKLQREFPEASKPMDMLTTYLASEFEIDNPKFDRQKFLTAFGIDYHQEFNDGVKLSDIKLVGED